MKKLIINSIKIMLISILISILFYPIVNAATIDCSVNIKNVSGIGNTVQIVSNSNSKHASISLSNMVQYLSTQNVTIKQAKDVSGNTIELNSTSLIGTGTSLISEDGTNYKVIVYGDATGDGQINAADISVIINHFLGTNTNISQTINTAADVQQDGQLNAADISLMINSFLGNLQGDILKANNTPSTPDTPTEDDTDKESSDTIKSGDYVQYPVNYTNVNSYYWDKNPQENPYYMPTDTGWRVVGNDGNGIKIVAAGIPERVLLQDTSDVIIEKLKNSSNFSKYVDAKYAQSVVGTLTIEEIVNNKIDWLEDANEREENRKNVVYCCVIAEKENMEYLRLQYYMKAMATVGGGMSAGYGIEVGIRPVVTLKNNVKFTSGNGTKSNPYILSTN